MKKVIKKIAVTAALTFTLFSLMGCGLVKSMKGKVPDEWYDVTRDLYIKAFSENWSGTYGEVQAIEDYTDKSKKFGYYLVDLDGDGNDEFLVGFDDGSKATAFTDVYIWHSDFGAFRIFFGGGGSTYYYLCTDKTIKETSFYGNQPTERFLKYNKEGNSFEILEKGGEPMKVELTYF